MEIGGFGYPRGLISSTVKELQHKKESEVIDKAQMTRIRVVVLYVHRVYNSLRSLNMKHALKADLPYSEFLSIDKIFAHQRRK